MENHLNFGPNPHLGKPTFDVYWIYVIILNVHADEQAIYFPAVSILKAVKLHMGRTSFSHRGRQLYGSKPVTHGRHGPMAHLPDPFGDLQDHIQKKNL